MMGDSYPVRWAGRQAIVTMPDHIDVSNSGHIREQLLKVINRGAEALIADMTATVSCDHAGADAIARAHQRAAASGTEVRLVVTSGVVRRVLGASGVDRLVPVYPSLEAALAARAPGPAAWPCHLAGDDQVANTYAGGQVHGAAVTLSLARTHPVSGPAGALAGLRLVPQPAQPAERAAGVAINALRDGIALADGRGVLVITNRQLEEMFGYLDGELYGRPVEQLIPAHLQPAHRRHRAGYAQAPAPRPMGTGARLVGLRKDGSTFPAEISLSPVQTATGRLTLTVVRDVTGGRVRADLAAATTSAQEVSRDLLDHVTNCLFHLGLSLQNAAGLPSGPAREHLTGPLGILDDLIREIRDAAFTSGGTAVPATAAAQAGGDRPVPARTLT